MKVKGETMFTIDTCEDKSDFDNMCLQPSNGGMFTAKNALQILERGNGGAMRDITNGKGYMVNYVKEKNDWLRKELKIIG